MMTEEQLGKVVPADTVVMVKNVSRVDQACSLLRSRFEVRLEACGGVALCLVSCCPYVTAGCVGFGSMHVLGSLAECRSCCSSVGCITDGTADRAGY